MALLLLAGSQSRWNSMTYTRYQTSPQAPEHLTFIGVMVGTAAKTGDGVRSPIYRLGEVRENLIMRLGC